MENNNSFQILKFLIIKYIFSTLWKFSYFSFFDFFKYLILLTIKIWIFKEIIKKRADMCDHMQTRYVSTYCIVTSIIFLYYYTKIHYNTIAIHFYMYLSNTVHKYLIRIMCRHNMIFSYNITQRPAVLFAGQ